MRPPLPGERDNCRWADCVGKLRPDQVPVIRAQVTAGYRAARCRFNRIAPFDGNGTTLSTIDCRPRTGKRLRHTKSTRQSCLSPVVLREIGNQVHASLFRETRNQSIAKRA